MSAFVFTVPAAGAGAGGGIGAAAVITRRGRIYGKDISYAVREGVVPNYEVTAARDWATTQGRECLRQSLIRRLITEPGEWTTNPNYGVGALAFVKARDSKGNRDELERRIRAQFSQDRRVKSVDSVQLIRGENSIKVFVRVIPTGEIDSAHPLIITHEVR